MEILLLLFILACFGGGDKKSKRRKRGKTNWDRLSYGQKAWLHDQTNGR